MDQRIYSFESLLEAYRLARRDNRYKRQVCRFDLYLESNLLRLQWEIKTGRYTPSPYTYFTVTEPKLRHVAAPNFRDRVFHHALISVIEPAFDKTFIYDSFACRKGKGTHLAMRRTKRFLQAGRSRYGKSTPLYILQCDIAKFFPSISWDILLTLIEKKITSPQTLAVIRKIITTHTGYIKMDKITSLPQNVINIEERHGLPIGNLTSQLFANVYLNPLDHLVNESLQEHSYGRYMDDFFIIHPDIGHLVKARQEIKDYLQDTLHLTLHPKKSAITNVKDGVAFVGYRIFYDHVLVRSNTLQRFQRKYQATKKLVAKGTLPEKRLTELEGSFGGHLHFADSYGLSKSLFEDDAEKTKGII